MGFVPTRTTVPIPDDDEGSSPIPTLAAGDVLGNRYELRRELGRGSHGVVFAAHDRVANELLALKVLGQGGAPSRVLARLRQELHAARRIADEAVVRVHDVLELDGRIVLSMELVDGETLEARLRRDPAFSGEALKALADDLAEGLAAAHRLGVVHRDLKPSNVILRASTGRAVIADFGVSSTVAHEPTARAADPAAGSPVGTPAYMAPEQARGGAVAAAADIYSLGVLIYECATGALPGARPAALGRRRSDLPRRLCRAVDRCLSPEPHERFRDGLELRALLQRPRRRRTGWLALALALALLAAAGLASRLVPRAAAPPWRPEIVPVTNADENQDRPAVSPDGRHLAIASTRGGHGWHIWLGELSGGTWRQLTRDDSIDINPQFIDGGRSVLYLSGRQSRPGLWAVDVDGATPPRFVVASESRPGASSDGSKVLYARAGGQWALLDVATMTSRDVYRTPPDVIAKDVALSPDATRAALSIYKSGLEYDLLLVDLRSGKGRVILRDDLARGAVFVPGEPDALVATSSRGGERNLWKMFLDGRPPVQLTTGVGTDGAPAISADGSRLYFNHDMTVSGLFVRSRRGAPWERRVASLSDYAYASLDAAGDRLLVVGSDPSDRMQRLWVAEQPFDQLRPLGLAHVARAVFTPDGSEIVACTEEGGRRALGVFGPDGEPRRHLLDADGELCGQPTVSSDGKLVAAAIGGADPRLEVVDRDGHRLARLAGSFCHARFSPTDPQRLAFLHAPSPGSPRRLEVYDLTTRQSRTVRDLPLIYTTVTWDRSGDSLYITDHATRMLQRVSAADGTIRENIRDPADLLIAVEAGPDGLLVASSTLGRSRLMSIVNFADAR